MISETHMPQGDMLIRDILDRMRHDGCGGWPEKAELLTGIARAPAADRYGGCCARGLISRAAAIAVASAPSATAPRVAGHRSSGCEFTRNCIDSN